MALSADQLNEINSVANDHILSILPDQYKGLNPLYDHVMTKSGGLNYDSGGGNHIQCPVQISENKQSDWADIEGLESIDNNMYQAITYAQLKRKACYFTVTTNLNELAQADAGSSALKGLFETKMDIARQSFRNKYAKGLFGSGNDANGKAINGLTDVFGVSGAKYGTAAWKNVMPAVSTATSGLKITGSAYAGLDPDDVNTWTPYIDTDSVSGSAMGYNTFSDPILQLTTENPADYAPDLIITTAKILSKYMASQQSQQEFVSDGDLSSGFKGVKINGVFAYADKFCQANYAYILSKKSFKYYYKYGFDSKTAPTDLKGQVHTSQALITNRVTSMGNLFCVNRKANLVKTNITLS